MTAASAGLHVGCAAICLVWAVLVLLAGRGRGAMLPAGLCLVTAAWAAAVALAPDTPLDGPAGVLEILRTGAWLLLLTTLSRRLGGTRATFFVRRFEMAGAVLVLLALALLLPGLAGALVLPTLGSPALLMRLALVLLVILLAENLWRNANESAAWHVNLPCIALGGLAAFDVLLYADAALSQAFSATLLDARAALTALAMPLLAVAAVRDRRWRRNPALSRDVVFHGATLVVVGTFLLGMGATSEALRQLHAGWGRTAQVSLIAGGIMTLAVALASRSVRSRVRRLVVDHFFSVRYDYRREWLRCVAALSAPDSGAAAPVRAIRAIADAVDSPAGVLLLRSLSRKGEADLRWAGSWNLPAAPLVLLPGHPFLAALAAENNVLVLDAEATAGGLHAAYGPLWLAVPLCHHSEGLLGVVALSPPRAPFPLDEEVFELLQTLGREVAMFLAERQAATNLADSRRVTDYAKRFAFVAHDVKTVSSQLTLLLANAEDHLQDPEFQADMLLTVRAAASRIDTLIERLRSDGEGESGRAPPAVPEMTTTVPFERLHALARGRAHPVQVEGGGFPPERIAMRPDQFDAVATHLLDNAAEASPPDVPVRVSLRREGGHVVVEIADRGTGMSPEFIRDELFRPLRTTKPKGNGIGAWQARELLRQAGGELEVLSRPGRGTTMRLLLPAAAEAQAVAAHGAALSVARA
ncbi:XrtA/PEP-CTERM system histidine kinase PrsK [Roseomonas sp. BN140053]|uniref:XrtA/PEP-CTERM system histidine kinase PrsK n=1 Tax=Roseomonas sp. BN140053 TaxID=3391898 RepID=UPI0039ECF13B